MNVAIVHPVEPALDVPTPWWPRPVPDVVPEIESGRNHRLLSGLHVVLFSNWPTPENVEAAKAWNPAAADLLDEWQSICDAGVDLAQASQLALMNEGSNVDPVASRRKFLERSLDKGLLRQAAADEFHLANAIADASLDGMRDWRAHVIDDAAAFVSLRHAAPGDAYLRKGRNILRLEGHDPDGRPLLRLVPERELSLGMLAALKDATPYEDPSYWTRPAFLKHAGRNFGFVVGERETARTLLSMAELGHRRAFLKGAKSKSGTWTVDLTGVETLADAMVAAAAAFGTRPRPNELVVQEHVPFATEQRFFVLDGRIVASVCSARSLSAADVLPDRILDPAVAVLARPEIESGAFDRGVTEAFVDRDLAASFARFARGVVRDLREEDLREYVLDVGRTFDGRILAIELNSFYWSGRYRLDQRRVVEARNRARRRVLGRDGPGALSPWIEAAYDAMRGTQADTPEDPHTAHTRIETAERLVMALLPDWRHLATIPLSEDPITTVTVSMSGAFVLAVRPSGDGETLISLGMAASDGSLGRTSPWRTTTWSTRNAVTRMDAFSASFRWRDGTIEDPSGLHLASSGGASLHLSLEPDFGNDVRIVVEMRDLGRKVSVDRFVVEGPVLLHDAETWSRLAIPHRYA